MGEKKKFVVSVDLGGEGQVSLKTHEAVEEWVASQIEFWQWAHGQRNDNAIQQAWGKLNQTFTNIRNINNEAIRFIDQDPYEAKQQALESAIQQLADPKNGMLSENPKSIFLQDLRESHGDRVAAYCLAMFMETGITANNPQAIQGSVEAVLYDRGIKSSARPEKKALATLKKNFQTEWQEYKEKYEGLADDYAEVKGNVDATLDTFKTEFAEDQQARDVEHQEFKETVNNQWEAIKQTFTDHMALQAPIEYWRDKKKSHRVRAIWYSIATAAAVGATLFGLYELGELLLLGESSKWEGLPGVTWLGVPLWHVVLLTVMGSVGVWIIRILVRLLLSEIHLMADADERVVMAKTYLALLKEDKGPESGDRTLILQTLFRPSSKGIVGDEAHPVMPSDWISKVMGK